MVKKTVWLFFFALVCLSPAHAQIGASIDDFKAGNFAAAQGFTFRTMYQLTDDPVYKGYYAFNFITADQRYKLQLIADQKGRNIVFEYLFYPPTDDQSLALKDGSVTLEYVAQASKRNIGVEQYISLVSEANGGARNKQYNRAIGGYFVTLTRYDTPQLSGWGLGIRLDNHT
jgi:hypothetical protein